MSKLRRTYAYKDQMLTGGLDFYHITTPVSIVPTADRESEDVAVQNEFYSQARVWERVIETIRTRANVVILGALDETGFSFAVEHKDAILVDEMQDLLQEMGEVEFSYDGETTVDLSGVTLEKVEEFRLDLTFGDQLIVEPEEVTLEVGETQQFTIEWASGRSTTGLTRSLSPDTGIVSIDSNDVVTALSEGVVTLEVEGQTATITVLAAPEPEPEPEP